MEENVNPWKSNLTNGLILGAVAVVWSLLMYFFNLYLNKTQTYVFMLVQIALLYFLLKSYRDNYLHGQITYGQAVGAGVIMCLIYALIMAIFTYIMYAIIDPSLVAKQLAMAEESMVKRGAPQSAIDTGMAFTAKFMKPGIILISTFFGVVIWGTILSLVVSIFVKKEGNPLIDTPAN